MAKGLPRAKRGADLLILGPVALLLGIGVLVVYTSSSYLAEVRGYMGGQYFFLARHATRLVLGVVAFLFCVVTEPEAWRANARRLFYALLVALLLVALVGHVSGGARRWIGFAFLSFEPSEFAKLALVLYLAYLFSRSKTRAPGFRATFLPAVLAVAAVVALVLLQPDVSTALLIAFVGIALLVRAGARISHLLLVIALAVTVAAFAVKSFPHAKERVAAFAGNGDNYQVEQAKIGFVEGGLVGVGLGRGKEKFLYLPAPHTDFIYAVVGEELGLLGALAVLAALVVLVLRGLAVSDRLENDRFSSLVACGTSLMLGVFGLAHVSVTLGVLPPTGLPMPFMSYGGSALVANMAAAGMLVSLSRRARTW